MRNSKLLIYGSSYDRGLEHLLKMWPDIRKEVPDAELHIFYGWILFDRVYGDNPERQAWKDKINKLMGQDGITHLGRISHEACVEEHKKAGIWAYPTHFGEISCITAMRAQAYGSIPVVINYAALKETVQHGVKVDGDIYEPEIKEKYVKELTDLLKNEKKQEEIRVPMMEWAREKFAWSNVAKQWSDEFKKVSLERQVEALMDDNQALKAWELVKDTDSPLKERVYLRVRHAFEPEEYIKYYQNDLTEIPVDEDKCLEIDKYIPRYKWSVPKILELKPQTHVDLGCADGALCLTLAKNGIKTTGVNLYEPSVKLANERAKKFNIPAKFIAGDIREHEGKYDVVTMQEVLEHLPDPKEAVKHTMGLLNESGHAFFSSPRVDHIGVEMHKKEENKGSWDDGKPSGHLRLFTEKEFKDLFKGYKILDYHLDDERCMNVEVSL